MATSRRSLMRRGRHPLQWRTLTAAERVARIERLLAAIRSHHDELLAAAAADFNRPAPEVELTEIVGIVREAKLAIRSTARWMRPRRRLPTLVGFGTSAAVRPEPRGRSLLISPWNYPYVLSFGPLISALAAGCPVIIKPSEITPHHARMIRRVMEDVFPPKEVAVVEGDASVAVDLCALPFDHIFFTGSTAVGRRVMAAAACHMTSVTLELGGWLRSAIPSQRLGPLWKRLLNADPAKFIPTMVATPSIQKDGEDLQARGEDFQHRVRAALVRVLARVDRDLRHASGVSEADQTMIPTRTKRMKRNCETRKIIFSPPVFFRVLKV